MSSPVSLADDGDRQEPRAERSGGGGSVADLLVETHPCCTSCGRKSVDRFRKLAVRKYGSWFEEVLASRPEDLSDADRLYVSLTWHQWIAGDRPFSSGRRHVSS